LEWVKDCESKVKTLIKRAYSKEAPKSIQIHRLSKIHNRQMKQSLVSKIGSALETEENYVTLCIKMDKMDIFKIIEEGFYGKRSIKFSNYLDCNTKTADVKKSVRTAMIVRFYSDKLVECDEGIILQNLIFRQGLNVLYSS
jgi:hypothetical protein